MYGSLNIVWAIRHQIRYSYTAPMMAFGCNVVELWVIFSIYCSEDLSLESDGTSAEEQQRFILVRGGSMKNKDIITDSHGYTLTYQPSRSVIFLI